MTCNQKFWESLDKLAKESEIEIEKRKGTPLSKNSELVYPVDYGYLKGTKSPDNAEIDVFVGSMKNQVIDAIICTVDLYKKDSEIKILIGCDEMEKEAIFKIYYEYYESLQGIFIRRE